MARIHTIVGASAMSDQSLRSHLSRLAQQDELIHFTREVDPLQNMAALEWKAYNELGKASLFSSIKGHPGWQACSQILTDRKKWAIAFEVEEGDLLQFMNGRIRKPVESVTVSPNDSPVKEVILRSGEADLTRIPASVVSERDPAPFIASGVAIVKDPDTGICNLSIHRQQIKSKDTTGFLIQLRHLWRIYQKYCALNQPMPVAIAVGVHPAIFFASAFTTSFGFDEMTVAGGLLGEAVQMVRCESVDLEAPAHSELVIEGEIVPNYLEPEGPFGEVTGNYTQVGEAHLFRLKAITHRRDPVFYAIHCGMPITDTQATSALGIEIQTREHLKNVEGGLDLLDVRALTVSGLMMLVIKLRPRYEGQAKTALMAALSGPYLHPKVAIAVDEDIDASDLRQIVWSMTTRVEASRDVILIPNTRVFGLDNVSRLAKGYSIQRVGTKWMVDATMPPLIQPEDRKIFEKAMPRGYDSVNLADFLP
jgi:2,5-furandicarboxylate decarboxylase 1